jgi:hypothetical protein
MAKTIKDAFNKLSEPQVERYMAFQHGRNAGGHEKSIEVLDTNGEGMLSTLASTHARDFAVQCIIILAFDAGRASQPAPHVTLIRDLDGVVARGVLACTRGS